MNFNSFVEAILYLSKHKADAVTDVNKKNQLYNEVLTWVKFLDNTKSFMSHVMPCSFIFDYRRSEMIYFSPSILYLLGIDNSAFLGSNGMIKFMDLINPNDFKVYNEQIFPKDMHYLNSYPLQEPTALTFSNNFRMKQGNGLYKTLLMKKCFITEPGSKLLMYEFGILMDITAFKKELSITHTIEKFHGDDGATFAKVVSEDYFPEMHANILSPREKEILTHLSTGSKRKEVGIKLFISDNTVANHIKTILRKTNSQNIREAIAICKMNGII